MDAEVYLDAEELGQLLQVSLSTIRRWQKANQIPFLQPGGPRTRVKFPLRALESMQRKNAPPAQSADGGRRSSLPIPKWMRHQIRQTS